MAFARNERQQIRLSDSTQGLTERGQRYLKRSWVDYFGCHVFPLINEARFSPLYSQNPASRPNTPVNVIIGLLMLKEVFSHTDDNLLETLIFDVRFQYALHTTSFSEQPVSDRLQGQISIVGLDHPEYFPRFRSLLSCRADHVDCALMSIGGYGQREKKWRYQLGSKKIMKAWRNLFHKSGNDGFDRTKNILLELLSRADSFTDENLSGVINTYINECEINNNYDWRYY